MKYQITKCAYRIRLEFNNDLEFKTECSNCKGFRRNCRNYATMDDVMGAYEEMIINNNRDIKLQI